MRRLIWSFRAAGLHGVGTLSGGQADPFRAVAQRGGRSSDQECPGVGRQGAALLIPDSEAVARVMDEVVGLLKDPARLSELSRNIEALAIPDSAERIVNEIERQLPQSK